ncbi:glycosyltransferase family 1 protein, partial [bacterium]|nr:glycosyltransferase family 1 protein [bacterium]
NVYVAELTRHLGTLGIHVDIFTRSQDDHVPHVIHSLGYGNRVVHIPSGPEVPLPKPDLPTYIPKFVEGIKHFACDKGLRYDLIHSHYWMSGIAGEALKAEWDVPVLQMFHTLGKMKNRIALSDDEMEGDYRIEGELRVMRTADKIIAATQAEESQLEFLYGVKSNKIRVIPPGVNTSRFYPIPEDEAKEAIGDPGTGKMLRFVGRIEALKGIDILLRALALMKQQGLFQTHPHHLAIIGGDPDCGEYSQTAEMARIKHLCAELGIGDLVVFLGKRDQETLPYYYSAAEVVIMPSHYESFGMVALEAMACGTPVVASQIGGLAFLVQDGVTGYAVPDGDPELLSQKLTELILDPDLLAQLGRQAAEYALGYRWEIITNEIVEVYNELLQPAKV